VVPAAVEVVELCVDDELVDEHPAMTRMLNAIAAKSERTDRDWKNVIGSL
jgi:cobalamin-dependent methionine synthase I